MYFSFAHLSPFDLCLCLLVPFDFKNLERAFYRQFDRRKKQLSGYLFSYQICNHRSEFVAKNRGIGKFILAIGTRNGQQLHQCARTAVGRKYNSRFINITSE